jgi:hypothetical protein
VPFERRRRHEHSGVVAAHAAKPHGTAAAVGVFVDEKHALGDDVTVDYMMEASPSIITTADEFDESKLVLPEFEDIVSAYLRIKSVSPPSCSIASHSQLTTNSAKLQLYPNPPLCLLRTTSFLFE